MPFGLGFFAVAGAGGAAGSFDLLETQVLGSSQASVTFSSLSTYASTYKHLQVRYTVRDLRASLPGSNMFVRLNADTASNYSTHSLAGTGGSVVSFASTSSSFIRMGDIAATGAPAGEFGFGVFDLLDAFDTNKYKTTRNLSGFVTGTWIELSSGSWRNTAATDSLTFDNVFADFVTGSRFSLYGIKGA